MALKRALAPVLLALSLALPAAALEEAEAVAIADKLIDATIAKDWQACFEMFW